VKYFLRLGIVLAAAAIVCYLPAILLPNAGIPVIFPVVELPAEVLWETGWRFLGNEFNIVNTFTSILLLDILLLIMGVTAGATARRKLAAHQADPAATDANGEDVMIPKKGWHNTFETIVEALYNLNEQIIGAKWAESAFPLVATIFFFVLVGNWLHFIPITDAVGIVHCSEHGGFEAESIGGPWYVLRADEALPAPEENETECPHGEGEHAEISDEFRYVVTPFIRTSTTDLNVTLALAIIAMVMVQVYGARELGPSYFTKFLNVNAIFDGGALGPIDFAVGFLELISEFGKMLALAFRLLGNIFAGTILLFVMAFLVPVGLPLPFFLFEVLIGFLQAFVFAMLTMVFISVAQVGHGHDDDHEDHGHELAEAAAD